MVEILSSSYEDIPIVQASLVTIDGELTEIYADPIVVDPIIDANPTDNSDDTTREEISARFSCGCTSTTRSNSLSSTSTASAVYVHDLVDAYSAEGAHYRNDASHIAHPIEPDDQDIALVSTAQHINEEVSNSSLAASGAAGAVLGLFMGGPILSIAFGIGALYYSQEDGAAGDIARAMGDVAIAVKERFYEIDEKHHLVDKSKQVASKAFMKFKDIDRMHRNCHHHRCEKKVKFRKLLAWCWKSLLDFEQKHKVIARTSKKAKKYLDKLVEEFLPDSHTSDPIEQSASGRNAEQ